MTTSLERFKKNAPKGYCGDPSRGAAMGRADINPKAEPAGPLTVCFVARCGGGYDVCGTYWGTSAAAFLYFAYGSTADGEDIEIFIWAQSLMAACAVLNNHTDLRAIEGEDIDFSKEDDAEDADDDSDDDDDAATWGMK